MRVQSYQEMLVEYNFTLDPDDIDEREQILSKFKYSVIIEGEWMEFENLDKWIKNNLSIDTITDIYYGKTGYNFGFREIFFDKKDYSDMLINVIPNIYQYPHSGTPNHICKSEGYYNSINYNPSIKDAIVFATE